MWFTNRELGGANNSVNYLIIFKYYLEESLNKKYNLNIAIKYTTILTTIQYSLKLSFTLVLDLE